MYYLNEIFLCSVFKTLFMSHYTYSLLCCGRTNKKWGNTNKVNVRINKPLWCIHFKI